MSKQTESLTEIKKQTFNDLYKEAIWHKTEESGELKITNDQQIKYNK